MHLAIDLRTLDRPGMERSGLGRYGLELTRALAAVRPAWRLTVHSARPELLPAGVEVRATRVPTASAPGRIAWLHGAAAFETLGRSPDVWFSPTFVLPGWRVGPSVVTIHDLSFMLLPERYRGAANARYATAATRMSGRRSSSVIVGATETQDLLVEHLGLSRDKIAVIPYGVPERFFAEVESPTSDPPFVLFVGTFEARKGLEVLHQAMAELNDVKLVLAGAPGWGTEELVGRLAADPRVDIRIKPPDEELLDLYRGALALAYPSRMEGFGLPVAEAMACGTPVVASDLPVIREFAGDAPLYAPVGDAAAIAAHLRALRDDPAERTRRAVAGRARAATLRWTSVAEATAAVIERSAR